MTGTFSVSDLRKSVNIALEYDKERHEKSVDDWDAAELAGREQWVRKYSDSWRKALTVVSDALDRGEPITDAHLPTSSPGSTVISTYREGWSQWRHRPSTPHSPDWGLLNLRTILAGIPDERVSFEDLTVLGVKPETIRRTIEAVGKYNLRQATGE